MGLTLASTGRPQRPHDVGQRPRQHTALALLVAQRTAIERRFQRLNSGVVPPWPTAVRESLLERELRCKLEELLLFPALADAGRLGHAAAAEQAGALRRLRDLADKTRHSDGQWAGQRLLLVALEGAAVLHFEAVDSLLSELADDTAVDWPKLGHQMQALLARWHDEIEETGDIEDEERDPVGLPPRF